MNKKFYIICLLVLLGSLLLSSLAFAHSNLQNLSISAQVADAQLRKDDCTQGNSSSVLKDVDCGAHNCQCISHCIPNLAFISQASYPTTTSKHSYKPLFETIIGLTSAGFASIWVPPLLG